MSTVPAKDNFRENLRVAMELRGMSQRETARIGHLSHVYVNRVLQGHTEPSVGNAEKLAKVVGFPLIALLSDPKEFSQTPVDTR